MSPDRGYDRPIQIHNHIDNSSKNTVHASAQSQASASSSIDFDLSLTVGALQGALAELKEDFRKEGDPETAHDLEEIEDALDALEAADLGDKKQIKKIARGPMNKLKRFLTDLENEESKAAQALTKVHKAQKSPRTSPVATTRLPNGTVYRRCPQRFSNLKTASKLFGEGVEAAQLQI